MAFAGRIPLIGGFGDFGKVLINEDILQPGNEYVFTYEHGRLFEYRSDSWVESNIKERIANYGNVISVNRGFFSDRYVVTVAPIESRTLSDWLSALETIWQDMGYGKANFLVAEEGRISTRPGGVTEAAVKVGEEIVQPLVRIPGEAAVSLVKPLFPYALALGGLALLLLLVSKGGLGLSLGGQEK